MSDSAYVPPTTSDSVGAEAAAASASQSIQANPPKVRIGIYVAFSLIMSQIALAFWTYSPSELIVHGVMNYQVGQILSFAAMPVSVALLWVFELRYRQYRASLQVLPVLPKYDRWAIYLVAGGSVLHWILPMFVMSFLQIYAIRSILATLTIGAFGYGVARWAMHMVKRAVMGL